MAGGVYADTNAQGNFHGSCATPVPDKRRYRKLTYYRDEPEADELAHRFMAETIARMIVDHADGLHERVTNGGADEAKTAGLQILAQRIRFRRARRNLPRRLPIIFLRTPANKLPNVAVERSELPLHCKKRRRNRNRRRNLQTVAHNPSVGQKRPHLTLVITHNLR